VIQRYQKNQLLKAEEIAVMLGLKVQTIYTMARRGEIPLRYEFAKGKKGNHLHAYIDGKLMGMFSDPSAGTLTGVQPGKHVLELRVTMEDHATELDAKDKVDFVVK
jgi:hypothetical protein